MSLDHILLVPGMDAVAGGGGGADYLIPADGLSLDVVLGEPELIFDPIPAEGLYLEVELGTPVLALE